MAKGGARPGAGRKKGSTKDAQQTRRDILLEVFTPEETRAAAQALLTRIKRDGDPKAFAQIAPFIFGKPPDELKLDVSGGLEFRTITVVKSAAPDQEPTA